MPYKSLKEASDAYIARDIVWELVSVVSGTKAHWEKRSVNIGYRVHINDGRLLQPKGSDDLGELKWFSLNDIHAGKNPLASEQKEIFDPTRVYLGDLHYGADILVETAIRKMRAWELCSRLIRFGTNDDFWFYMDYLLRLKAFSFGIEERYGLKPGALLANCLTGPRYREYVSRALALHNLRPRLEKELHRLKPGSKTALALEIERQLLKPFICGEDYAR